MTLDVGTLDTVRNTLTLVAALGSGLLGGVFLAFSTFVMRGLSRLPAAQGAAAMRAINVAALEAPFMAAFWGSTAACAVLAALGLQGWDTPTGRLRLLGCGAFLVGGFLVTAAGNVPLNVALAAPPQDADAEAALWRRYLSRWTAWNHLRTVACLAAAAALTLGLR
jgi:uncharacterized membrane protein